MEEKLNLELTSKKPERNMGIDALRILSMLMITGLHLMGHGGILRANAAGTGNYYAVWFLEIMCYCAVNCYALISGYVGIKAKFKITNLIVLWLQVSLYSFLISAGFYFFKPGGGVTPEQLFRSLLPITAPLKTYWYFTCYVILFFFIPAFNAMINTLSKRRAGAVVGALLFLTCFAFPLFKTGWFGTAPADVFGLANGYSVVWLAVLYLTGAYISKYKILENIPKWFSVIIYIVAINITFTVYMFGKGGGALVSYISPTIFISALALLLLFKNLKLRWAKPVIKFLAPTTFGVYLIHENPYMRNQFITGKTATLANNNPAVTILIILGSMILIYTVCSLIDYLRHLLFKVLKIRERLLAIEEKLLGE